MTFLENKVKDNELFNEFKQFLSEEYGIELTVNEYLAFAKYCELPEEENGVRQAFNPINLAAMILGVSSKESLEIFLTGGVAWKK